MNDAICPGFSPQGCDQHKEIGDVVMLGPNNGPKYRVIGFHKHYAWVEGICYPDKQLIVDRSRLRLIERATARLAA